MQRGGSLDAEFTGPILASLAIEFVGTYPHDALRVAAMDGGMHVACRGGVWLVGVRFRDAERRTTHENQDAQNSPIIV